MAKGHVTEDDLASGVKGFGGLSFGARPPRDNPFRDTRTEPVTPQPVAVQPLPIAAAPAPEASEPLKIEVVKTEPAMVEAPAPVALKSVPAPKRVEKKPQVVKAERAGEGRAAVVASPPAREKKTEAYTEKVSLPLNAELRDGAETLAKELQRMRTSKDERITANTVMRVAIRVMLEQFEPRAGDIANNEEQLFELVKKRLG